MLALQQELFLVRQLTFLAVQTMKYRDSANYPRLEALKNTFHQHPMGLVGLGLLWAWRLVVLAQAPAASCCGEKTGLRTSVEIQALLGALLRVHT